MDFSRERIAVIFFPTFPLFLIPNFIGWNKQNTLYHQKPSYFFLTIGAVAFSIYFSSLHLSSSFFSLKFTRSIYYLLILSVFTSFLQFHLLPYPFFGPFIFPSLKWLDAFLRQMRIEMLQSESEFLDQSQLPVNRLSGLSLQPTNRLAS